ncbi:hypothetical protein [Lacisediminihabitans sp. H27-G8]|uniref:hypothetical protein n=1 Tax=Lacisediminihabitans sp. H27-G8 TaxID=3111909 RepID=UPI0038FD2264
MPAMAVGAAVVGASVVSSPQQASASTYQGLPTNAVGVSLLTKPIFAGFNAPRTLATFHLPGDASGTRRSRMFYGEYYSVDDIKRLKPYVEYICVKSGNDVKVWDGGGKFLTDQTTAMGEQDRRRLSSFQPYDLPSGASELYREATRGAQFVKYRTSGGELRYRIFWYDGDSNYWRDKDVAATDARSEQFQSGYSYIKHGNQEAGVTLASTILGASWAGNLIVGGGFGAIAGGVGVAIIAGLAIYYVYDACYSWTQGFRYMDMIF